MIEDLFTSPKPVVGVIHVGALPGTPASALPVEGLTELAVRGLRGKRPGLSGASEPAGTKFL